MNKIEIEAKEALDKVIKKSRVHLYKPIQIAEILYRDRVHADIDLNNLETYRTKSRIWRDSICNKFVGRSSTSSARFQDNLFDENAIPPRFLSVLGDINRKDGIVESHIYKSFSEKLFQMDIALDYCLKSSYSSFKLKKFIDLFWEEAGLKRSIDKIFEIVVYALFETIVVASGIKVSIFADEEKKKILSDFEEFSTKILGFDSKYSMSTDAHFFRVGVTNAADRGLDIFANFGSVIQVKHLTLSTEVAQDIVGTLTSNRVVIVCRNAESHVIESLLNQIGWKSRIQSIVTIEELCNWYDKALVGSYSDKLAKPLMQHLVDEIKLEFPSVANSDFKDFIEERGYKKNQNKDWKFFE
jgi:hypothetical protein